MRREEKTTVFMVFNLLCPIRNLLSLEVNESSMKIPLENWKHTILKVFCLISK